MTARDDDDARPSPAEARAALADAAQARQALAVVKGPRWAVPVIVTAFGLVPLTRLLPTIAGIAASGVLVAAIVAAALGYAGQTGVTFRPQRSWLLPYLLFTAGILVIFVGGGLLEEATGFWWIWLVAAPLNVVPLVLLERALRRLAARQGP